MELRSQGAEGGLFTAEEQQVIHRAAGQLVTAAVLGESCEAGREALGRLRGHQVDGIFVTLKRGSTLRGCCGSQRGPAPLHEVLAEAALRTATQDPRMPSVSAVELPFLELSVSILGPPLRVEHKGDARLDALVIGRHGVRIRMGQNIGLLLPTVATERNWDARQFLDAVCRKARLAPAAWRSDDALLEIFDGVCFSGAICGVAADAVDRERSCFEGQIGSLQRWVLDNLVAISRGEAGSSSLPKMAESDVAGVVLHVANKASSQVQSLFQFSLVDEMPLQETLFKMTEEVAMALVSTDSVNDWRVDLAVLDRPVHHGSFDDYDVRGIDAERRAIVATDGRHWSLRFDRRAGLKKTIRKAMRAEPLRRNVAQIYSVQCLCSDSSCQVSTGPRGETEMEEERLPAVSGIFYPADDAARNSMLEDLLSGTAAAQKQRVNAAMVPHAALRYSGRVAAEVWGRLEIPRRVLIIGPKHTRAGVDWAIAPHHRWRMSDATAMAGDYRMAEQIADAVPGMQLDAAAHREEHGIEVQLPLLYQLAPNASVCAIAMHGGSGAELEKAATAFADWLKQQADPPLLVISSDMNHFADDEENRRRDRVALDAMKTGEAETLLSVCEAESISMCGRLPAAFVLATLKALGQEADYQEVAYATSAEVSGDTARVVGYAGVML